MLGVCVCVHVRVPNAVFFLLLSWVLMFSLVAFPSVHLLHSLKHFSISRYSLGGGGVIAFMNTQLLVFLGATK